MSNPEIPCKLWGHTFNVADVVEIKTVHTATVDINTGRHHSFERRVQIVLRKTSGWGSDKVSSPIASGSQSAQELFHEAILAMADALKVKELPTNEPN